MARAEGRYEQMLRRFLRDKRANVAMMFGFVAVPLIAATGAAIDYSRAFEQRMVVQDALDSAALAANRLIGLATESEIYDEAMAFFNANTEGRLDEELTVSMVIDGGSVTLTTELPVPTTFLGIVGVDDINFDLKSRTIAGAATYEIALVLDNSGSMQGSKLSTLKTAARDLINSLFELNSSNPQPDPVKVAIIPFAASVNIGANNANQSWMDQDGASPVAGINHDWDDDDPNTMAFTSRFDLYDSMNGVDWLGCVEARPYPYDVDDTTPTPSTPATLFNPMFAPDEPDDVSGIDDDYDNNYLADDGSDGDDACVLTTTTTVTGPDPCAGLSGWQLFLCRFFNGSGGGSTTIEEPGPDDCDDSDPEYERCRQERVCKYDGVNGYGFNDYNEGPNRDCTTQAVTELSTNRSALLSRINQMSAGGNTNIQQGVVWGWHALSQTAPFTAGREYGDNDNHKIMIVMTDGANTYRDQNTINHSEYMAFNYVYHEDDAGEDYFLDVDEGNNPTAREIEDAMNDRTIETCDNLHGTEITVYTIAFQIDDPDSEDILLGCASDENKAFEADDNDELIAVFRLIAQDIATLRIAE